MNLKNEMKSYSLILLEKQKIIGKVDVSDDFAQIVIKINFTQQRKYQSVFKKLVEIIKTDNNFIFNITNLKLSGVPKLFWPIFTQKLMSRLGILVKEEDDSA